MDDHTVDLIRQLCTRAGMIMEDVSAQAVCTAELTEEQLSALVAEVSRAAEDIRALTDAASALLLR